MNPSGALRQQIEDMALRLVVGEPENSASASAWVPVLEKIAAEAAHEHAEPVASAAAACAEALRTLVACSTADGFAVSAALQEGVARLQIAVEESAQQRAPQSKPLAWDPELMSDFVVESREHLVQIESQVLDVED